MEWNTRVTELLGCKYPILEGAYGKQGGWKFAAKVANTGAHGLITASVAKTPEKLREYIRRCRDATDGTFGVNLTFGICPQIEEMLEACLEEKVQVETAAFKPDLLAPRIKAAGVKWIHKTARVQDALHAEKLGADAVIVVGLEGTGFKQVEQMPTMFTTILAKREIKIPLIAAGGIGDARGFLAALTMGADGIMMGTAFMATREFPLSSNAKDAIIKASPYDVELRHRVIGSVNPADYEEVMSLRNKLPLEQWLVMLELVNLKEPDWRNVSHFKTGQELISELRAVSLAATMIDRVTTVKELIDSIISDAEELLKNFEFLKTR
jgi:nitronate monooxygenase